MLEIIPEQIKVFLIAMLPILEVRGAIPWSVAMYEIPHWQTYIFGVAGNITASAIVLYGLQKYGDLIIEKIPKFGEYIEKYLSRARRLFTGKYEKWGVFGLVLFVGIPLPMTGAWTGSAVAYIFGFDRTQALYAIIAGVFLSAAIMLTASVGIEWLYAFTTK